ncbi:DEHA2F25982p [Debaryomyces hansenii CBS767]|uniref:DEHA2F25982p n=1 Tax=Debaryomyces hansenii (strain ATCC 36239 / CBS 767 / BCRC 21394 / JCM 1990 / NBRC 0083 / IGC 2968) TaxID=284592 RepID=Q6BK02_DEBHA|nr:DEHA2F25982p [Debaryomyces hansenii CBS767]CAG89888.2 DEHA2F25982p [Debaryomyces hansenii CBS767]|eukprot:XP_461469.2 DEHA2F25982p [Debaryomyces hansenii CBS767]
MASSENLNEFKESHISNLAHSSIEELTNFEDDISKQFNSLSKEYLNSRVARINHLINSINYFISKLAEDETEWSEVFSTQTETINNIKTNTEDLILSSKTGSVNDICDTLDEYEDTLKYLFQNIRSPLSFLGNYKVNISSRGDVANKARQLPFEGQFDNVIRPYGNDLKSILGESHYNHLLLESNTRANSTIIWKQYQSDLVAYKNKLINETYEQLNDLYKEHHNVNKGELNNKNKEQYYRSVISPTDLKRSYDTANRDPAVSNNHDNYYDSNNSYFKKNKIELTNEKYRILSQLERFERSQAAHANTSNISYKLNSCSGLSDNEIVNDIHLLRNSIANKSIINEEEPDIIEPQTDTNEEDQEITEESLKQKYKQLLSMSSDTVSHPKPKSLRSILADSSPPLLATGLPKLNIPELPPLEAFPKLQNKSEEV